MKKIKVKICGIKNQFTALEAERNGADAIGLVFCEKSHRCISIEEAQKIKPPTIFSVGFILKECPEYTIIAGDLGRIGDSDCGRVQVIPGQWIKKKLQVK